MSAVAAGELLQETPAARPCLHPRAQHQHGTYPAYKRDGCRCLPCRDAASNYAGARARQVAYGRWAPYVDAEPAREHLQKLSQAGIGWRTAARRAGLDKNTVRHLLYGQPARGVSPTRRIRPKTERAILAVQPRRIPAGAHVEALGTRRRLQALVAAGWSQAKLARHLDLTDSQLSRTLHTATVLESTRAAVALLYDQIAFTDPPRDTHRDRIAYSRARRHAATQGWAPPPAWFLGGIDDPDAAPDWVGVRPETVPA